MPFAPTPFAPQALPQELSSFGVNVDEINQQVDTEIQDVQSKSFWEQEFITDVKKVMSDNKMDFDTAFDETLKYYKSKDYTIEWIDIDAELWGQNQVSSDGISDKLTEAAWVVWEAKEQKNFLEKRLVPTQEGNFLERRLLDIESPLPTGTNVAGWAIAWIPSFIGNALGTLINIGWDITQGTVNALWGDVSEETADLLWNEVKRLWELWEDKLQEILWVEPEAFSTAVGQFTWDMAGSMAITWWLWWLVSWLGKLSQVAKFKPMVAWLSNIISNSPKLQAALNINKAWLTSLAWFTTFQAGREWELPTPAEAITSYIAWPVIDKTFKVAGKTETAQAIKKKMGTLITKFSPSKLTQKQIDKQLADSTKWMQLVKSNNPNLVLQWDDAVGNFVNASATTKKLIWKELEKARGFGWVDMTKNVSWLDRMTLAFKNPTFRKKLTPKELKEFNALNAYDTNAMVGALKSTKENFITKLKNGKMAFDQADDYIIKANNNVSSLYNNANKTERVALIIDDALNSKMKQTLDSSLDDATKWASTVFRNLKKDYNAVRNVEDNLTKIYAQILRKKDASLTDFTDVFVLSNLWEAIATANPLSAWKAGLSLLIRNELQKKNDPNIILSKVFKLLDKMDDKTSLWDILKWTTWEVLKREIPEWVGFIEEQVSE